MKAFLPPASVDAAKAFGVAAIRLSCVVVLLAALPSAASGASARLPVSVRIIHCTTSDQAGAQCSASGKCCDLIPALRAREEQWAGDGWPHAATGGGDGEMEKRFGTSSFRIPLTGRASAVMSVLE